MIAARLVWTLAHSLWQAGLVAMAAAVALRVFSRHRAETRYAITAAAMLGMIVLPLVTFTFHAEAAAALRAALRVGLWMAGREDGLPALSEGFSTLFAGAVAGWIAPLWIAGVSFSAVRLTLGWFATRRIVRAGLEIASGEVAALLGSLQRQLGLARPVRLLVSAEIDSPAAVGWLRPAVLLPAAAITGLDTDLLRAVIAHELAHIRRHDFAINILQRSVEALLFYHPAVWWLSRRMRAEREHCCDDTAVRVCGGAAVYARALLELERSRGEAPALAMAAGRTSVRTRLLRVLGRRFEGRSWGEALGLAMLVLAMGIGLVWPSQSIKAETQRVSVPATEQSRIERAPNDPLRLIQPGDIVMSPPPEAEASFAPGVGAELVSVVASLAQDPVRQEPSEAKTGTLGGQLRRADGSPAAGVQISALSAQLANSAAEVRAFSTTTDAEGRYRFDALPPGDYSILTTLPLQSVYFPGTSGPGARLVTVVPGEVIANLDFRLRPPIAGSLTGQIRDSNGAPAAGVHISATPVAPGIRVYLTETDQDGRYGLDVMQGTYLISATAPSQRLSSAEGRVVTVTAGEFIKGLDFSFPPPGNTCGVAGIVPGTVRMVNGSPLPGLSLLRLSWEFRIDGILQTVNISRTDAGGSFTLSNLRQGATTIAVAKAPLGYYVKALTFGGTDLLKAPLVLPTLSCSAQIEIVLARTTRDHGVRISGRATNLEFPLSRDLGLLLTELPRTGEPAPPGSDLSDLEFTANRRTGVFSLEGVPAGRYKLTGYLSNFTQAELIIDVARNDVADLELRFGTSAKPGAPTPLNSSATAVIRGVVEGASGGVPGFVIEFASMRVGVQALSIAVSGREFTVQLPQGEYRASVSGLPRGYNLDSLTAGPLDLREPFLVTEKGIADRFTGAPIPDSAGGPEAKAPAGISVRLKAPGN